MVGRWLRQLLLLFLAWTIPLPVWPAAVDLDANRVMRAGDGTVTAAGDAHLRRSGVSLSADMIRYQPDARTVDLYGQVHLRDAGHDLYAERGHYALARRQGVMERVYLRLSDGAQARARRVRQRGAARFDLYDATFTTCRVQDRGAWSLRADRAELDQDSGEVTLHGATFNLAGVPLLYAPYWQYPLRRRSGLLLPRIGFGKRRGNELALPIYWAAAPDWDVTLVPHWMSARGLQGSVELRHASSLGRERVQIEGLRDRQLGNQVRKAGGADVRWAIAPGLAFDLHGRFVGDRAYLADFSPDAIGGATRYLTSAARLSWQGVEGRAALSVERRQDLAAANDAATLQILPRLESHHQLPLRVADLTFGLDQQTTNFIRSVGSAGTRVVLAPWLELPWRAAGGGARARLRLGVRRADYRLRNGVLPVRQHSNSYSASLTMASDLERVSVSGLWRHQVSPVLRYDRVIAPDQSRLARFDTDYARLNMSNLLQANRFSGNDRVERVHRLSLLLTQLLQHKTRRGAEARTLFRSSVGITYDFLRQSVDPALKPVVARPWSNLVGSLAWLPWRGIEWTADGQYDPVDRYWAYSTLGLSWRDARGDRLSSSYRQTDRRYATAAEALQSDLHLALARRWQADAGWHYDLRRRLTRYATLSVAYAHPCWRLAVQGYRNTLQAATRSRYDTGFRIEFTLKGVGG